MTLRSLLLLSATALLAACIDTGKGDDSGDTATSATDTATDGGDGGGDGNDGWPASVTRIEAGEVVEGDLATGELVDLDWADQSNVACFPATEFLNFEGNHVFYAVEQPEGSVLSVTVTPDADVDVSVYMLQYGGGSRYVPPEVPSAVTCEAGFDQTNDSNPGEAESASVTATTNPYTVLIGVAGPAGVTAGAFQLSVDLAM